MDRFSSRSGESAGLGALRHARPRPPQAYCMVRSVSRFLDMVTFADGACETRSRSKEKAMQGHRRRRATQRSSATPISPEGGGGTASIPLSLLLHDVTDIASLSLRELDAVALATNATISRKRGTKEADGVGTRFAGRTVRPSDFADAVENLCIIRARVKNLRHHYERKREARSNSARCTFRGNHDF